MAGGAGVGSLDEKFCLRVRILWRENNLPVNQIIHVFHTADLQQTLIGIKKCLLMGTIEPL